MDQQHASSVECVVNGNHAADGAPAPRTDAPGGGGDAPPSNTASNKCNVGEFFTPLRWGADSLYLSFPGTLAESVDKNLSALKTVAQAEEAHGQVGAQYRASGHIFEVRDKGAGFFPYVLADNCFRISLSRPKAESLPMAYVQVSSHFLCAAFPDEAERRLREILDELGDVEPITRVSRIDLYVDFVSDVDMESWSRRAWVTRAHSITTYSELGRFTGWGIGVGGVIGARLYDKTVEIEKTGKQYLKDLWRRLGWQEGQRVWRLEFEFKRELLTQKGLSDLRDVLSHLCGLWSYATDEWLRLTLPSESDDTRSRWPIHPLWQRLASVDFGGDGGPLLPRFVTTRAPSDDYLCGRALGLIFSFMAKEGRTDFEQSAEAFIDRLVGYGEQKTYFMGLPFPQYVQEQVAIRGRRFNTIYNRDEEAEDNLEAEAMAREYRKRSGR